MLNSAANIISLCLALLAAEDLPAQQNSLFMAPDTLPVLPTLKTDFLINSLSGDYGAQQLEPAIAADSSGNYAVAWIDLRNIRQEVYVQFFNNRDEPLGNNVPVSDRDDEIAFSVSIAANERGDFVVAWENSSAESMVQRFSNTGEKIGSNIRVNSLGGSTYSGPAPAVAGNGSFMVVWSGWDNQYNIHASIFNAAGSLVNEVVLNDTSSQAGFNMTDHSAAVDGYNNFVVVWYQSEYSTSAIFLQQIDPQGNKVGNNKKISSDADTLSIMVPSIMATADGYFFIIWNFHNTKSSNHGTTARIYRSADRVVSGPLYISENNTDMSSDLLAGNRKDAFWISIRYFSDNRLVCQQIGKSGEPQGEPIVMSWGFADSLHTRGLRFADLATGQFCLTFIQDRRSDTEIFIQKYDLNLLPLNEPVKADLDPWGAWQTRPLVCFNQQGNSIVLWEDRRNGRRDLYAQVYDQDYNAVGENLQINDMSGEKWYLADKKIQALSDGKFVIAFSGTENVLDQNIYLQIVDPGGYKINANKLVKKINNSEYDYNVEIKINRQDQILLCWYNRISANLQKYDQSLADLSTEKILYKNASQLYYQAVAVSINEDLNIFITMQHSAEQGTALYGLLYDQNGKVISQSMNIGVLNSNTSLNALDNYLTDSGDYIVIWINNSRLYAWRTYTTDQTYTFQNSFRSYFYSLPAADIVNSQNHKTFITYLSGYEILGCYLNDNKHEIGFYHLGYNDLSDYYMNQLHDAAMFNDDLFFAYESNRHGDSGLDIWGNVQSLSWYRF